MEEVCGYCGALGFKAEVQGYFKDKNGKKQCHFGQLCCNKGKVHGISDYNLPGTLERLYTSDDEQSVFFFFGTMQGYVTMLLQCHLSLAKINGRQELTITSLMQCLQLKVN